MKTLIIYLSRHGTTQKVARMIQNLLSEDCSITTINLAHETISDLSVYERIIIGTSVYFGKGRKPFAKFCTNDKISLFAQKDLGIFLCGIEKDSKRQRQELENVFSEKLLRHAKAKVFVGGEVFIDKLSCLERITVRTILKISEDVSTLNEKAIEDFVTKMKS